MPRGLREKAERGRRASVEGFANEHIALGILMKKYENVSLVDLPHSKYDIVVVRTLKSGVEKILRLQVKTAKRGISFGGGARGGVDRRYLSGVKTYTHSTKTCDCIVGVRFENQKPELYFVPTVLVEELGTHSISINKVSELRNNFRMLERCKSRRYVLKRARKYGII